MGTAPLPIAPMGAARSHFASAVHGGRLYVFGGGGANFSSLDASECYDPHTDRWTPCAPMRSPRSGISAATVGDAIYVMGGGFRLPDGTFDFKSLVEIYLPKEDRWISAPSLVMRHDAPASVAMEDQVFLFGGHHPDAVGGPMDDPAFNVCERLTTADGAHNGGWRTLSPMPTPRFSLGAAVLGREVWALGGGACQHGTFRNLDLIEILDPRADHWRVAPTRLPWPAAGPYATVINHQLIVAGGISQDGVRTDVAGYNPHADTWTTHAPLPQARVMGGLHAVGDTLILVGGRGADGKTPVADGYRLNLAL